ncbi:hypothetical protein [Roseobacter sp.]|uniref:hypothetical protein n=1 Tax=Roseobacter sp. TaxID=1907202 RepID=UPI0029675F33|nr:hypothetical protein [Roseobacter sp.]MDW3181741.1 hypothetical protein [Roseobacter sp.]
MKFPTRLPFDLRCQWEVSAERSPLTNHTLHWQEVVWFATQHGCTPPLPANIPQDVLQEWEDLERRRDWVLFADQWTAVKSYADTNGFELSKVPEPPPEETMRY